MPEIKMLSRLPANATLAPFDHELACGLIVRWSLPGVGFGELTIRCEKATGAWTVDDEHTSPATVARILQLLPTTDRGFVRAGGWGSTLYIPRVATRRLFDRVRSVWQTWTSGY